MYINIDVGGVLSTGNANGEERINSLGAWILRWSHFGGRGMLRFHTSGSKTVMKFLFSWEKVE